MTDPERPRNLRVHGAVIMAFAALLAGVFLYFATEVYPSMGWEIGRYEGYFFGISVVLFLFGLWVFVTNRPVTDFLNKLDNVKWWQWMIFLFLLVVVSIASFIAWMLFMLHHPNAKG